MWTSSSNSSSSRSLSSSTSCPYSTINNSPRLPPAGKTMEEVWKDISLASDLPHHPSTPGVILQDFFSKDPPPASASSSSSTPPAPPPPPTMLTLSSATHHFTSLLLQPHHQHVSSLNMPSDAASGGVKKRLPDFQTSSGDRRHDRMIKNRESAARSRARKQAYTNELELEVAQLLEENARLKEQHEQLYRAAAARHQKRKPLHRTLTAPF